MFLKKVKFRPCISLFTAALMSVCIFVPAYAAEKPIETLRTISETQYKSEAAKIDKEKSQLFQTQIQAEPIIQGDGIVYSVVSVDSSATYYDPYYHTFEKCRFVNNSSGILTGIYTQVDTMTKTTEWSGTIEVTVKPTVTTWLINIAGSVSGTYKSSKTVTSGTTFGANIQVPPGGAIMLELKYAGVNFGGTYDMEAYQFGEYMGRSTYPLGNNWFINEADRSIVASDI